MASPGSMTWRRSTEPDAPVASGGGMLPTLDAGPRWYALWTRSRHERMVREQLDYKRIETFLPTVARWRRWKDRKKKLDWPLFPGYCFARFDAREPLPVRTCSGVVSILSIASKPAPIPDHEIEDIRQLVESKLAYDPCPFIYEGMMVEVWNGPLQGVVARLVRKGRNARLVLALELIGGAVSAEVDAADVRPLPLAEPTPRPGLAPASGTRRPAPTHTRS